MGQKSPSPLKSKANYDLKPLQNPLSSVHDHIELQTIYEDFQPYNLLSPSPQSQLLSQQHTQLSEISLQILQQQQKRLQFIGEIIYYCKLHMRKQRKYHYKISALLFYKYFLDKFRQLLTKYSILYQQKVISLDDYQKKVNLVCQVKDTFGKIRKFVYSKIPFMSQKTKRYLDEEDDERYCFDDKKFFTELLYPEVGDILKSYFEGTNGELHEAGINECYMRMIKSIFIIQELESHRNSLIITTSQNCHIGQIDGWSDEEIKQSLRWDYERFLSRFIQFA